MMVKVKPKTTTAKPMGICCICGNYGVLSEEHVPPKKAFNTANIIAYEWEGEFVKSNAKGKVSQGGYYRYTLCEPCNNKTGSWYGGEYVKWARNCQEILGAIKGRNLPVVRFTLYDIYPLRFLKQVVTCFFSEVGHGFNAKYRHLSKFLLEKTANDLPEGLRLFMNLYPFGQDKTAIRHIPFASKITVNTSDFAILDVNSLFFEIAHPPFQLIMTWDNESFPNATEITAFSNYNYDDNLSLNLEMKVLGNSNSPLPRFE